MTDSPAARRPRPAPLLLALGALALALAAVPAPAADASVMSRAFVGGQAVPVHFNDGDTFRMHGGPYAGRAARLAGFNTLESYGPTHQWGAWHPYELYVNAMQATLNARRGVWHCTSEGETDTYGRVLLDCPDLAVDQLRKGLAHAMNVDDRPSRPEYIRAQQEAIRNRRGMWAHGVPDFVVTSLHSISESTEHDTAYNRLVSTRDGHSEKWEHREAYGECAWVCADEVAVSDEAQTRAVARALRADAAVAPRVADLSNLLLVEIVDRWARLRRLPEWVTPAQRQVLEPRLAQARATGALGPPRPARQGCMLYVTFERRYGRERAPCLRGRGSRP